MHLLVVSVVAGAVASHGVDGSVLPLTHLTDVR
jgi:hypothetical protein